MGRDVPGMDFPSDWAMSDCPASPWPEGRRAEALALVDTGWTPELRRWSVGQDGIRVEARLPDAVAPFGFTGEIESRLLWPREPLRGAATDSGLKVAEAAGGHSVLLGDPGAMWGLHAQSAPGAIAVGPGLEAVAYLPGDTDVATMDGHTLLLRTPVRYNATKWDFERPDGWASWVEVRDASFGLVANLTIPASAHAPRSAFAFASVAGGVHAVGPATSLRVEHSGVKWSLAPWTVGPPSGSAPYFDYFTSPESGPYPDAIQRYGNTLPHWQVTYWGPLSDGSQPERGFYVRKVLREDASLVWLASLTHGAGLARILSIDDSGVRACWVLPGPAPVNWFTVPGGFAWIAEGTVGFYDEEENAVLTAPHDGVAMLVGRDGAPPHMAALG